LLGKIITKILLEDKIHNSDTLLTEDEYGILRSFVIRKYNFSLPAKLNSFTLAKELDKLILDIKPK
jgi:hypothetical protein